MQQGYKKLKTAIFKQPLALNSFKDKGLIEVAESYLPYSVGIEVECSWNKEVRYGANDMTMDCLERIPTLLQAGHSQNEKRFRINKGIRGMLDLYEVTQFLRDTCDLNPESGIHYHIDMTELDWDYYNEKGVKKFKDMIIPDITDMFSWIIDSLKSWNYKGTYNSLGVAYDMKGWWVNISPHYKTMEFRIGEMSFDYEPIIKRIIHCSRLVKRFKKGFPKQGEQIDIQERTHDTIERPVRRGWRVAMPDRTHESLFV